MNVSTPITQDLVLIGGGHSHAIALEQFAMNPLPGMRLTLITDVSHTPYSGMLPGYVAGLYGFDECHIDLWPLAQRAGARLILDRATGLDLPQRRVRCAQHPPIAFDYLSIDVGSTPSTAAIEGAEHLIPVKPISKFLARWDALVESLSQPSKPDFKERSQPPRVSNPSPQLAIVGAGAGGIELAFAIEARFRLHGWNQPPRSESPNGRARKATRNSPSGITSGINIHLFQRGDDILPNRSRMMRRCVRQQLKQRHIQLQLGQAITAVERSDAETFHRTRRSLRVKTRRTALPCDAVFWVTGASAAPWITNSGLKTDAEGFIAVNTSLQSSHPRVFAAGDIATMVDHPRPKAGVFAVRQGQPLYENLRRSLLGQPLKSFIPQQQFLILVGTGDGQAIASRGPFALGPSSLLWRWKDHIDRAFMARFAPGEMDGADRRVESSAPYGTQASAPSALMQCQGCGAKVGGAALSAALARIRADYPEATAPGPERGVLLGLDAAEDAAVLQPPTDSLWVQTVDYFPALVADPFLLGQITAHHCLNDLYAMGASPHSVLAIATLPHATPAKHEELLYHLLAGLTQVLSQEGAVLLGGHTVEGDQLALGLTCNGTVTSNHLLAKSGLSPNQSLILTKPLGTGTLFAAAQQQRAKGRWLEGAIAAMTHSNAAAAACLRRHGAAACTDITGFGLLGHLLELLSATANQASPEAPPIGVTLSLANLPLLDGAASTLFQGIVSSLAPQNQQAGDKIQNRQQVVLHPRFPILFDPQTAGGLLAAVPQEQAAACVAALQRLGYVHSAIVGQVNAVDPRNSQGQAAAAPVTIEV